MLSQNNKTIKITLASIMIAGTTLGGAVCSAQNAISAAQATSATQTVISTDQNTNSVAQSAVNTEQNTFNNEQYKFPPSNAVPQLAPSNRQQQGYPMPYPSQRQGYQQRQMPMRQGGSPYGMRPNNQGQYNQNPYNQNPYAQRPNNQTPYGQAPYNRGPYGNPYNSNPYGRGQSNNSPFGGNSAPWESWPFGGRDSFWNRKEMPFKDQSPADWFQPGDPKEGAAIMWDDMISSPDDLGTMPGGWNVPSVSVPNPVDLEDQLERASKEVPDIIRIYSD